MSVCLFVYHRVAKECKIINVWIIGHCFKWLRGLININNSINQSIPYMTHTKSWKNHHTHKEANTKFATYTHHPTIAQPHGSQTFCSKPIRTQQLNETSKVMCKSSQILKESRKARAGFTKGILKKMAKNQLSWS